LFSDIITSFCLLTNDLQWYTKEALVSRHPWNAKEVSITEAGHSGECKNKKIFLLELRKTGFSEEGHK